MRRQQNLAILSAVVTGAVIATGLLLLVVARINPQAGERVRGALLDVVTPVWSVVRAPFDGLARLGRAAGDYLGAVERARLLEARLAETEARLMVADADRLALAQLRPLVKLHEPRAQLVATARVVAVAQGGLVRTALVSAGRAENVVPGLPVLAADGLVGRTMEVGSHAARVLLLTDAQSRVPVLIERTRQAALLSGDGSALLTVTDRVGPETPLRPGDRLLTSGDGGVYPPGVLVGLVQDAGPPVRVRPAVGPMGMGFVRIEAAWRARIVGEDDAALADDAVPSDMVSIDGPDVSGVGGAP